MKMRWNGPGFGWYNRNQDGKMRFGPTLGPFQFTADDPKGSEAETQPIRPLADDPVLGAVSDLFNLDPFRGIPCWVLGFGAIIFMIGISAMFWVILTY